MHGAIPLPNPDSSSHLRSLAMPCVVFVGPPLDQSPCHIATSSLELHRKRLKQHSTFRIHHRPWGTHPLPWGASYDLKHSWSRISPQLVSNRSALTICARPALDQFKTNSRPDSFCAKRGSQRERRLRAEKSRKRQFLRQPEGCSRPVLDQI